MDAKQLYSDLLNEIATDERALERKRELAELLRTRLGIALPSSADLAHRVLMTNMVRHAATRLNLMDKPPLTKQVQDLIKSQLFDVQFSVNDVYTLLAQRGELPDQPKTKIATVLGRLVERGTLLLVSKGAGTAPNQYRLVNELHKAHHEEEEDQDGDAEDLA